MTLVSWVEPRICVFTDSTLRGFSGTQGHKGHQLGVAMWPPASPAAGIITWLPDGVSLLPRAVLREGVTLDISPLFLCPL